MLAYCGRPAAAASGARFPYIVPAMLGKRAPKSARWGSPSLRLSSVREAPRAEAAQIESGDLNSCVPTCREVRDQFGGDSGERQAKMLVTHGIEKLRGARGATYAGQIVWQCRSRSHPTWPVQLTAIAQGS